MAAVLSGCATVVTSAAQKAWESRSTEDQVTDSKIHTGILNKLKNKDKGLLLDVSVDVWEQRVLLTGTLDDSGLCSEIESLAKQDSHIKILHNHYQSTDNRTSSRATKWRGDPASGLDCFALLAMTKPRVREITFSWICRYRAG